MLWQIAVLAASLGLAWLLQWRFERRFPSERRSRRLNIGMHSMSRLMFPLFALVLVIPGEMGCLATGTPRIFSTSWSRCYSRSR